MKRLLAVCFLSLAACNDALAPSPQQSSTPVPPATSASTDVWPGHYIVVMRSGATSTPEALVHRHALNRQPAVDQRFGTALRGFAAAVDDDDVERLRQDPDVERIEPDRIVHQMGTETGMGWALDRIDQHSRPLNGAYAYGATGSGVNIYIVDGGVRYSHTEFGGRAHFAFDALGGNGSDCSGHGTGVAGVAGGSVHGVAKSATIWSVRVFPCSGSSALSTILAGVDWITAHHRSPAVANLSLGAGIAPILDSAVSKSIASGVTYVVAAGNSGIDACNMSPAKVKTAIAVGATDATDARASWSNYGSCIALFAPGASVPSADYYSDVSLANWNGTSMAAPFVAGAAALYLEKHPSAAPAEVRSALLSNATGSTLSNLAGSTNRLLYTSFISGTTTTPAAPTPSAPTPPVIARVAGVGVSYKCASRVCAFDASASAPAGGVSSYKWTFGDGATATSRSVVHTYGASASYPWTLVIVDNSGHTYKTGRTIAPVNDYGYSTSTTPVSSTPTPAPSGTFTATFSVSCNTRHSCTFDASRSTVPNGVSSYNWHFGDGYQGTSVKLTHDYSGKKTVSVMLNIIDKKLVSRKVTQTVVVP
jgi:aqualysin 1